MKPTVMKWGAGGIAALVGAMACSGTSLNNVGELNGAGSGGSPAAGGTLGSGNAAGSGDSVGSGNSAGSSEVSPGGGGAVGAGGTGNTSPGGRGGVAGNHTIPADDAGAGGEPDGEGIQCPAATCALVASDEDIRGVAANDTKVFWIDYGTSDALGNYDGQLMARDLSGGATTVLASALPGPESVSLSSQYAYMFVDQRTEPAHAIGVIRVPLAGGAAQPLQSLTQPASYSTYRVFAAGSGYEYWNWDGAVYRIAETAGATVETFLEARGVLSIAIAGSAMYFQDTAGIWSVPLAGGTPTSAFEIDQQSLQLQLVDTNYLYARETASSFYLTRMPRAGGAWARVANLDYWSQLELDSAGHFFIDPPTGSHQYILQGSLMAPATLTTLVSKRTAQPWWKAWTLSSVGIFVADSYGLYLTPTASP
jgi:hypothetical protein